MITLRPAAISDVALLRYWDTKQHVIDCAPDGDWNWETELGQNPEWREHLIAELNGEPIGFVQIIDPFLEETHYWGKVAPNKRAIDIWIGEEVNLNKQTELIRRQAKKEGQSPPADLEKRKREFEKWKRKVGWIQG